MEIRGMSAPPSPTSAPTARPVTDSLRVPAHNRPVEPVRETRTGGATQGDGTGAIPLPLSATLKLDIDQATKQVYAKVVDPNTGSLLRELPSEKLRALQAFAIKTFRPTIDEKA